MKAKELISLLQSLDPNTEVVAAIDETSVLTLNPILGIEKLPIITMQKTQVAAMLIGDPVRPDPSDSRKAALA